VVFLVLFTFCIFLVLVSILVVGNNHLIHLHIHHHEKKDLIDDIIAGQ